MTTERLILNTLTFELPKEPVKFYFSDKDDAEHKSTWLKSPVLIPDEVKTSQKFPNLFSGTGGVSISLFTTFDRPTKGFEEVAIDFNKPENEYLVKRYYSRRLEKYFRYYDNVVLTQSGITKDLQVWLLSDGEKECVNYGTKQYELLTMDRFTLKVGYDHFNNRPYLLVTYDRPAQLMKAPLAKLFNENEEDPFSHRKGITPSMINKVMTREVKNGSNGHEYVVRKIERYEYLQEHNMYCPPETTRLIMNAELKKFFGLDKKEKSYSHDNNHESKYVRYMNKIEGFRKKFLNTADIEEIFSNLAFKFTSVDPLQIGQTDSSKRMLVFGKDSNGNDEKNVRQQWGVNFGPRIKCPYTDIRLIAIYHEDDKSYASKLLGYFKNGNYKITDNSQRKRLSHYIGTNVTYAEKELHIEFKDKQNPVKEISEALMSDAYRNLDPKAKYVGIYVSPIHKYASEGEQKECYYKIKELFLMRSIPTQCIDSDKMKTRQQEDDNHQRRDFIYTLQNMGVAICAKLGGSPWLLDEAAKKELIIGIGAFKSDDQQYIGAAFSFDNTGAFNDYSYFQKSELDELVGAIETAIQKYTSVNNQPSRLIIHYYKKISRKREFKKMEDMLHNLNLDIPVYIVTINKTESEDIVLFDESSTYHSKYKGDIKSLMPYSGKWVNLGHTKEGYRYLLCNNTRYENESFNAMDGFPFPIKLTIACPNRKDEIDTAVVKQLIDQVYQFSRIYWKSVKQQGLPVTIKYPEMIAEIMPHFESKTVYIDPHSLWFL